MLEETEERKFGPKRNEVKRGRSELLNEELFKL
jgi:hypothetical protein